MNIGSTYDGDMGNEVVLGDITVTGFNSAENSSATGKYQYGPSNNRQDRYKPWKLCSGSMTFSMKELVMVEPLDYYSTRGKKQDNE